MANDSISCSDRFTRPELVRERTLSDCKEYLYKLSWTSKQLRLWKKNNEWKPLKERDRSPKEDLAEFIRDVIAFANAARRYGEPGYILFGVEDKTKRVVGIEGQSTNPKISLNSHIQEQITDLNVREFNRLLEEYVAPSPVIKYLPCDVNGRLCSYLEILHQFTDKPYEVRKNLEEIRNPLRIGDCWVRKGESKYFVPPEDKQFLYNWTQFRPIEPESWKYYLEQLVNLPGKRTQDITGYQRLDSNNKLTLSDELYNFFRNNNEESLLIIEGQAGCGKSVFLRDQVRQTATELLNELDLYLESSVQLSFTKPVPAFLRLNNFAIQAGEPLAPKLLQLMKGSRELGLYQHEEPEKVFRDESKHWIVFLDAFDESNVDPGNRANLWSAIYEFIDLYSNVQVILTTRPDASPPRLHQRGKSISINPLTRDQILGFLKARMSTDVEVSFEEVTDFLDTEEELWRHLEIPLFVSQTAFYFVGDEDSTDSEEDLPISTQERENATQFVPKSGQKNNDDDVTTSTFDLKRITGSVMEQLTDEAEETYEIPDSPSDKPLDLKEEVADKLRMGIFLHRVFEALWEHNQKKILTGFQCGQKDDTFENLGEMAAHHFEKRLLRKKEVEQYLDSAIHCVLDLGILIRQGRGIQFPTCLSKSYFVTFFIDVLLETQSSDIEGLVVPPLPFWEKCSELLVDISANDISPFIRQLEKLKGEVTHG